MTVPSMFGPNRVFVSSHNGSGAAFAHDLHGQQTPLVIWGASGHALVVAGIVALQGDYEILGFLDDVSLERQGEAFAGKTILGGREQLDALRRAGTSHILVAIGDCRGRLACAAAAQASGLHLATAVHPRAIVANDVVIGPGTVIAAGAIVNPGCRIGENVIVNTGAVVEHECRIEDGAHIGPGSLLGGRVVAGRAAWIGIGACVRDRVHIGAGSLIGAGAVVVHDIPEDVVAYGVPAKVHRTVEPLRVAGQVPEAVKNG